jgi:hypothetical protein
MIGRPILLALTIVVLAPSSIDAQDKRVVGSAGAPAGPAARNRAAGSVRSAGAPVVVFNRRVALPCHDRACITSVLSGAELAPPMLFEVASVMMDLTGEVRRSVAVCPTTSMRRRDCPPAGTFEAIYTSTPGDPYGSLRNQARFGELSTPGCFFLWWIPTERDQALQEYERVSIPFAIKAQRTNPIPSCLAF